MKKNDEVVQPGDNQSIEVSNHKNYSSLVRIRINQGEPFTLDAKALLAAIKNAQNAHKW